MSAMNGVAFGSFIVPGLTLLSVFMQSIFNASFGIYFPKFTGTIYELLSAPISSTEAVLAYVAAAVYRRSDGHQRPTIDRDNPLATIWLPVLKALSSSNTTP